MFREVRISEILFDSDGDECRAAPRSEAEDKNAWKKSVRQYKILSAEQIVALEEFFISGNLPITKTNIRLVARKLKIPYQRSANYLHNKYKKHQENAGEFYQRCISEFGLIAQNIEKCWDAYHRGRRAYDMDALRGSRSM